MFGVIKRKCYLCREITKYNNEQLACQLTKPNNNENDFKRNSREGREVP